ncbi:MAG: hypothetical protein NTY74_14625 [Ignavibacteriae bacterium]|nr:hypothetical protein [Ignavibacteriota bacterium]
MFPEHCKIFKGDDVFGSNGFDEIPAYNIMEVIEPVTDYLVSSIKTLGENCCGYIDGYVVNHHFYDDEAYFINMDEKYVFAYFKDHEFSNYIPVMILLEFLKYKANKFLLIYKDMHFLLKKNDDTYKVCEKMDEIFKSRAYIENVLMKSIGDRNYENIFYKLMEIYSVRYMNKDIRTYDIIDILLKVLKLDVV